MHGRRVRGLRWRCPVADADHPAGARLSANTTPASGGLDVTIQSVGVLFATPGGELEALAGCTLDIPAGSFTVIIGPNGCGKSTLLRLVAGLLEPTTGSVAVGASAPRPGDGRVGLAFQQPRLIPWRSTLDNVALPLEIGATEPGERRLRARMALERVGLSAAADLRPRELSGGMAQRAALARALITDPPVLLLDEPFSALDALTRETFDAELQRLWLEQGRTVVLVTHSVAEAVTLADRVVVMSPRPGRVARTVDIDLPRPRPSELMGDPRAAELAAHIREALASAHALELRPWAEQEGAA
jgi:NitT/TauT family transport system ATP-binding protein